MIRLKLFGSVLFFCSFRLLGFEFPTSPAQQVFSTKGPFVFNMTMAEQFLLSAGGIGVAGSRTFAANTLNTGDTVIIRNAGKISTGATPGVALVKVYLGNKEYCDIGVAILPPQLTGAYEIYAFAGVRDAGQNGNLVGGCRFWFNKPGQEAAIFYAKSTLTAIDTTVPNSFDVGFKFSVSAATNQLISRAVSMEHLPSP